LNPGSSRLGDLASVIEDYESSNMNAYSPTRLIGGSPDGFGLETPCKQPKEFELLAKEVTPYLELLKVGAFPQYP